MEERSVAILESVPSMSDLDLIQELNRRNIKLNLPKQTRGKLIKELSIRRLLDERQINPITFSEIAPKTNEEIRIKQLESQLKDYENGLKLFSFVGNFAGNFTVYSSKLIFFS
jgi:hypothetical protein